MAYNEWQLHRAVPWALTGFPLRPRGAVPQSAKAAARAEAIRHIFITTCRGCAELEDVRIAAINAGLLDDCRTPNSQKNVVRAALSVIAEPCYPGG